MINRRSKRIRRMSSHVVMGVVVLVIVLVEHTVQTVHVGAAMLLVQVVHVT